MSSALGEFAPFGSIDVNDAVVPVTVHSGDLRSGPQVGGNCVEIALDLEVHGLALGVQPMARTARAVIVCMELPGGHERHLSKAGLHVLEHHAQPLGQAIDGSFG